MGHTILTSRGKTIHLLLDEQELWDPIRVGDYTRAYCHLHGSDHQRSLAIHRASGWGRCYSCGALVLMQAYHPALAKEVCAHAVQVLTPSSQEEGRTILPFRHQPSSSRRRLRSRRQPSWQEREHTTLRKTMPLLREACGNVSLADCWQALAYLETRGIPLPIARAAGVGYLPTSLLKEHSPLAPVRFVLQRWVERLIFPLHSPDGTGFLGRTLWRWQLGMDEATHQGLLEDEHEAPRRWIKSHPAGWFCPPLQQLGKWIVVVEGGFDRLALLAAGIADEHIVALAGTTLQPDWLPAQVQAVILALDADAMGRAAMARLISPLEMLGLLVIACPPEEDGLGKDWSERWRRAGIDGVAPLFQLSTSVQERLRHLAA